MATGPTKVKCDEGHCQVYKWTSVATGATLTPIRLSVKDDVTIYVFGTSNSEAVALHGSPEAETATPTLYAPLKSGGTEISLSGSTSVAACALVDGNAVWYKPVCDGNGDGSTALTIWLVAK